MAAESNSGQWARGGFASTQWSLILAAKGRPTSESSAALTALCSIYWRPLYTYLRRRGYSVEEAQDLTQGYFSVFLEKNYLRHVEAQGGRFRSFLLASLKNFIANQWDRENAKKRGGQIQFLSLDEFAHAETDYAAAEMVRPLSPEMAYERKWALTLLDKTTSRLATEFATAGKSKSFERLRMFLTGDSREESYAAAAAALRMSEVAVRVAVHRMRGRFRDILRDEIAQTIANPGDPGAIEEEVRYLLTVL